MSLNNVATPSDAVSESVVDAAERHRRWLRRVCWTGGLLVVVALLIVIAYQMSVTWTLRQHGWELTQTTPVELFPEWVPSSVGTRPEWVPESVAKRIAPFDCAFLLDRPQPCEGDLDLLRQYSKLDYLAFRLTALSESSLAAIAQLKSLGHFQMISSNVDEEGLRHLNALPKLRRVVIHRMRVGDVAMRHIANCRFVEGLFFAECHLEDDSLAHFSKHANLQEASFTDSDVGDRVLEHLSSCRKLSVVSLEGTRVTDDGIVHLAKTPKLKYLEVTKTPISDAAIQRFVAIRSDVRLRLRSTNVTQDAVDELQRKYPDLRIELSK